MSDWITWESCPECGDRAAVGWGSAAVRYSGAADDGPVEFDCPTGCAVDPADLLRPTGRGRRFGSRPPTSPIRPVRGPWTGPGRDGGR